MNKDLTNVEKLDEIYEMTLENNEILKGMRRREKIANAFRIFYWLVIVGAFLGVYYYISPFLGLVLNNKTKIEETFKNMDSVFPEIKTLNKAFKDLKPSSYNLNNGDMPDNGVINSQ